MSISDKLNALYLRRAAAEREPFRFRPSALGGCLRQQAFLLSGMEPLPSSPEQERTFELGHQRGERLEELLNEAYPDAQTQHPVRIKVGKFTITGTCDAWIPSMRTIIDFKTAGGYAAGLLEKEGASVDYQLQVHAYRSATAAAEWFEDEKGRYQIEAENIRAVIIYECKDSDARKGIRAGQLIEVDVPYTDRLEELYQTRLNEIERLMLLHELGQLDPDKVAGLPKAHWRCKLSKEGQPLYCSVGSIRGKCHE